MLNGIDPLIIITLYNKGAVDLLADIPFGAELGALIGFPIPIYLSERLTGIYVDSETRGIDVSTKIDPTTEKDPLTQEVLAPIVTQTALDSNLSVTLLASRDSIMLTALIAMAELILSRLVTAEYGITYINGPTVIFNGLLQRFQTNVNRNDTLVRIDMVLSNAKKDSPTPKPGVVPIPKVTGAIPL